MNNVTPNPVNDTEKQLYAIINTLIAKINHLEERINILEATVPNDIKSRITSD